MKGYKDWQPQERWPNRELVVNSPRERVIKRESSPIWEPYPLMKKVIAQVEI